MHFSIFSIALLALPLTSLAQNPADDPYVPKQVNCTDAVVVRPASKGLSKEETDWRKTRLTHVIQSLETYLPRTNITGFNVTEYISKLKASNAPVVGLAISGGGSQSGMGGLGLWQAFDERYAPAVAAGIGGLQQCLTYLTGLSGGGYMTVASIASYNFTSISDMRKTVPYSTDYLIGPTGNATEYYDELFENAGAKAELGFPVSVIDVFGQTFRQYLPESWRFKSYSDIAEPTHAFTLGTGPMPIISLAEVIPGQSPQIGGIMFPGRNSTNGINLTSWEVTPFEFGSWIGGRVQGFFPTKWLGSAMRKGKPQAKDSCVNGFDRVTFIQGSTSNAFNFWLIDAWYNIPLFAKRSVEQLLSRRQSSGEEIVIPPGQEDNPLVQLANMTATEFDMSFNDTLWAKYPNPFQGYNEKMAGVEELLLIDGSTTGETMPIRPLIIPERKVDFLITYDASLDAEYSWVNATNLIDSARSASQGGMPFPRIPSSRTMVNLNITSFPTFFGCNYTSGPLILYLPNAPWTTYSNYSYTQSAFTDNQFDMMMDNQFNLATYGNGKFAEGEGWPACLACGVIKRSLTRVGMEMPDVCTKCFERFCWNGEEDEAVVSEAEKDHRPILDPGLSYLEWNQTWWSS